jgi:hypothetical protein
MGRRMLLRPAPTAVGYLLRYTLPRCNSCVIACFILLPSSSVPSCARQEEIMGYMGSMQIRAGTCGRGTEKALRG